MGARKNTSIPEWSKGVHLRCTALCFVGSSPTAGIGEHGKPSHIVQLVRILRFHRSDSGSNPDMGKFFFNFNFILILFLILFYFN